MGGRLESEVGRRRSGIFICRFELNLILYRYLPKMVYLSTSAGARTSFTVNVNLVVSIRYLYKFKNKLKCFFSLSICQYYALCALHCEQVDPLPVHPKVGDERDEVVRDRDGTTLAGDVPRPLKFYNYFSLKNIFGKLI